MFYPKRILFQNPIPLHEFRNVIQLSQNTAPGMDEITYVVLEKLRLNATIFLNDMLNEIWTSGKMIEE